MTDLAMESPRLWFWGNRLTLLVMVSLVYAFLRCLLAQDAVLLVQDLLRGATEPEIGTAKPRYRFPESVPL
ncbi:MAG: hypothetical protein O2913_11700 [Chloroflexi bacterium]|nr:hypothetical protein [Chloroflexota bacterium]